MPPATTFNAQNFTALCDAVAATDADLAAVIAAYGYPAMWIRTNTFESLIHIILEQQVSLASALAALNKLRQHMGQITAQGLLQLTDDELKACYFSRQKTMYARHLAQALITGQINLEQLALLPNDEVRRQLTALKGIGNWTVDVYLMFVLQRADIFPVGDLAAVNAIKQLKNLPAKASREYLLDIASHWQPYRTIATMLLWHWYLSAK